MGRRTLGVLVAAVAASVTVVISNPPRGDLAGASVVPAGFTDSLVADVSAPTALAFHPDGRILVTSQLGQVRLIENDVLLPTPALDLGSFVCANGERGMVGITVDPAVATNGFVYIFYTANIHGECSTGVGSPTLPVNRVSRFTLTGNTIDPATELILVDNMPNPGAVHNSGDVHFGNDGYLYFSIGDGGCDYASDSGCQSGNDAARDLNNLNGKIVRITNTGAIPPDNPYVGPGTARCNMGGVAPGTICQEIFATGLRNPFRIAFDPNTPASVTSFRINDVGQSTWEEINEGIAAADYGWNVREGHCATGSTTDCGPPPAGMTNPIYSYSSSGCDGAITGGAFVPNGAWPSGYGGDYLYGDYVCGAIYRLEPDGAGGFTRTTFASDLGGRSAVHLAFGPSPFGQALYYTTYFNGGEVRRITPPSSGPQASFTATPSTGPAPLTVKFDASASTGDGTLIYMWTFGDGSSTSKPSPTVRHTYAAGTYTASLVVRDGDGTLSPPATMSIVVTSVGNTPPTPTITSPSTDARFAVGQMVTVEGQATDAEDGAMPPADLSWQLNRVHVPSDGGVHTHPLLSGAGASISFTYPEPEDLDASAGSYIEAILTATDSDGATAQVTRQLIPNRVTVTLLTKPAGLQATLATPSDPTRTVTAPYQLVSWQGWVLTIGTPSPQGALSFVRWSDAGAQTHSVVTPAANATYRAIFR